jgi:hypothetical protein
MHAREALLIDDARHMTTVMQDAAKSANGLMSVQSSRQRWQCNAAEAGCDVLHTISGMPWIAAVMLLGALQERLDAAGH